MPYVRTIHCLGIPWSMCPTILGIPRLVQCDTVAKVSGVSPAFGPENGKRENRPCKHW